jgi:hypothetical protein
MYEKILGEPSFLYDVFGRWDTAITLSPHTIRFKTYPFAMWEMGVTTGTLIIPGIPGDISNPPLINISPLSPPHITFLLFFYFYFFEFGFGFSPPRGGSFPQFTYPINVRIPPRISKFLYIFSECNVKSHGLCSNRGTGHSHQLG